MKTLFITLFLSFILGFSSFAHVLSPMNEKTNKLIKMVDAADKDDWQTLNLAASLSINWNADLELAKQWVEASIEINDNPEGYEILGDYYLRKGEMKKAYDNYFTALEKGIFSLSKKDRDRVQRKVLNFGRAL